MIFSIYKWTHSQSAPDPIVPKSPNGQQLQACIITIKEHETVDKLECNNLIDQIGSKTIEKDSGIGLTIKDICTATPSHNFKCHKTEMPSEGGEMLAEIQ